jgi:hypothetical protein
MTTILYSLLFHNANPTPPPPQIFTVYCPIRQTLFTTGLKVKVKTGKIKVKVFSCFLLQFHGFVKSLRVYEIRSCGGVTGVKTLLFKWVNTLYADRVLSVLNTIFIKLEM